MPVKLNQFNGTQPIAPTDNIIGYSTAVAGGERRWTVQQLLNLIKTSPAPGTPVQLVQTVKTNKSSRAGTNPGVTWLDVPGLARNIKLETNNPDIRVQAMINASTNNSNHFPVFRIVRVAPNFSETVVGIGDANPAKPLQTRVTTGGNGYGGPAYTATPVTIDFFDNKMTGLAGQTFSYKIQWWVWATSVTAYINTGYSDANTAYDVNSISTLTLTEIAS